jgi:hypothetical protein
MTNTPKTPKSNYQHRKTVRIHLPQTLLASSLDQDIDRAATLHDASFKGYGVPKDTKALCAIAFDSLEDLPELNAAHPPL